MEGTNAATDIVCKILSWLNGMIKELSKPCGRVQLDQDMSFGQNWSAKLDVNETVCCCAWKDVINDDSIFSTME